MTTEERAVVEEVLYAMRQHRYFIETEYGCMHPGLRDVSDGLAISISKLQNLMTEDATLQRKLEETTTALQMAEGVVEWAVDHGAKSQPVLDHIRQVLVEVKG